MNVEEHIRMPQVQVVVVGHGSVRVAHIFEQPLRSAENLELICETGPAVWSDLVKDFAYALNSIRRLNKDDPHVQVVFFETEKEFEEKFEQAWTSEDDRAVMKYITYDSTYTVRSTSWFGFDRMDPANRYNMSLTRGLFLHLGSSAFRVRDHELKRTSNAT